MANEIPKYSPDGKPLNEAARKAMNTAIKNSARATQDRINTLSGKTTVSPMANVRGRIVGGGLGGMFGTKNR